MFRRDDVQQVERMPRLLERLGIDALALEHPHICLRPILASISRSTIDLHAGKRRCPVRIENREADVLVFRKCPELEPAFAENRDLPPSR